jgi:uncharacterized membrane protein
VNGLEIVYALTAVVLWCFAWISLRDGDNPRPHRLGTAAFWLMLGAIFAFGSILPHRVTGLLVLAMVAIDGAGLVRGRQANSAAKSKDLGDRIFWPVLVIPVVTFATAVVFRLLKLDPNRGALIGLGVGAVLAMIVGLMITRSTVGMMLREGHRLNEAMGAVNILPQLLASLGVVFTAAKVGDLIASGIRYAIPESSMFLLVLANCLGMTLFTIVMGNSFAAFPVIASGVLVPLIVRPFGVDPAMAGIITLTAGSSGTLITIMAANFNVVPVALLNMQKPYGVIRFQLPYALTIWTCHVLLLWALIRLA